MFITSAWNVRNTVSSVLGAAPDGTVDVGQLTPVDALPGSAKA